ncbi:MAG: hypothetical protein ABGW90_08240 [Martelella sp.]
MKRLYGEPTTKRFGHHIAGVYFESPRQAMLFERIMQTAMQQHAGRPEQSLLAHWHNQAVRIRRKAGREAWVGWEDDYPVEHEDGAP